MPLHRTEMLALAVLVGASACARSQHALTLAGSTSLQPYAERWADAFNVSRPDLPMYIQGGGSTAGVQAAISGAAQIGMASRRLTPAEAGRVDAIPVARDGLAIVVHPTNPLVNLTLEEARAIYSGVASNWRVLGGPDLPITVITREEGSGTRAAFEELVMHGHRIAASALVQDSTGAVRQMVASDPAAVGYISLGLVDGTVKAVALGGVTASEAEIDAGRYPLVRPFLFVVPKDPSPAARAFIEWVTGPEGRALTRREGLLPPEG